MRQTPLSRLIEKTLGVNLREYVILLRSSGKDWRSIAADLTERTGEPVSHETVRSWFADEAETPIGGAA